MGLKGAAPDSDFATLIDSSSSTDLEKLLVGLARFRERAYEYQKHSEFDQDDELFQQLFSLQ